MIETRPCVDPLLGMCSCMRMGLKTALVAYDVCGDMIHRLANGSAAQQGVRICIHTLTHAYLSFVHVIADS